MRTTHRRDMLRTSAAALSAAAATTCLPGFRATAAQAPQGERPKRDARAKVLNPRGRVPLSFIIDDSTCLVNMGHFCMPQFAACYPQRQDYKKPWKSWPREIPDAFVREFGEWCAQQGVKGKYSIVPYPACVGWLDRELPGWSRAQLLASLKLVRELMLPDWDIHPEMITHTRVIDLKTGRPHQEISSATMENSYPQTKKSVDELAAYLGYALRILKNCDLPCEGITTPGGFGNRVKSELSQAVRESVSDVFKVEIPHYFKYVVTGAGSTEPTVEHVKDLKSNSPQLTVSIPAGTGDWFGGWDGVRKPEGHRYAADDASAGRLVDLIKRGQPALMLCHWPGMYNNGTKIGFRQFQKVVLALAGRFGDQTIWMKLSEIARYWAAKELTAIRVDQRGVQFQAPFACPDFSIRLARAPQGNPVLSGESPARLQRVLTLSRLRGNSWLREREAAVCCFHLPKGQSRLDWS